MREPIATTLRWEVWERDDFRCQHCGTRNRLTIDHIVPVIGGGRNTLENLQTLCHRCNAKKGPRPNRVPDPQRLSAVKAAADVHARRTRRLNNAIRAAHAAGHSLRTIAEAAGVSHEQVRRVIHRR
jgi:transposase